MSRQRPQRMRHDQQFWQIVKDLRWRLEDAGAGAVPAAEPEFGYGVGRRSWGPAWITHLLAFVAGGVAFTGLLFAPAVVAIVALGVVVTAACLRGLRR